MNVVKIRQQITLKDIDDPNYTVSDVARLNEVLKRFEKEFDELGVLVDWATVRIRCERTPYGHVEVFFSAHGLETVSPTGRPAIPAPTKTAPTPVPTIKKEEASKMNFDVFKGYVLGTVITAVGAYAFITWMI